MIRRHGTELRALMMLADALVTALLAAAIWRFMPQASQGNLPSSAGWSALVVYVSSWVLILWILGAYRLRTRWSVTSDVRVHLNGLIWLALGTLAFLYGTDSRLSATYLVVLFGAQLASTVLVRGLLRWAFQMARRRGRNLRTILILGTGPAGRSFAEKLEAHSELGLTVLGFVGTPTRDLEGRWPYLGSLDQLTAVMHEHVVDEVAICLVTEDWALIESIAAQCETEGKVVRMPVPMPRLSLATGLVEDLDGMPVLSMLVGPRSTVAFVTKRLIDLSGAIVGMLLLAPLFAAISLAIAVTDGRPILYRQERVGLHGRRFDVVKFRSMVRDAEARLAELQAHNEIEGHAFKVSHDPRITRIGNFLRKSSLDELPQLWNVVRGEMSLVGPRPPLPSEVAGYDMWHRRRLSMKPGMTGLWQIEGRQEREFDRWVQKDLEYIDRWSPWLDIKIILRTIPAVLRADGR